MLTAHIVFTDDFCKKIDDNSLKNELKIIQQFIYEEMQDEDFVPFSFKIRDFFPYAKSGKRDVLSMMRETDDFIIMEKYSAKVKRLTKFD